MFKKYPSIENHYSNKFIEKIRCNDIIMEPWVANEKIHGTNFSVIITKDNIVPCKRTDIIKADEKFFEYENLMKKYLPSFISIQNNIHENEKIQIFGEYAGKGIQKGVDYGEKDLYIFDVMINDEFTNYWIVECIANESGFKLPPKLGEGNFEDLISLPNEFDSLVNKYNDLIEEVNLDYANKHIFTPEPYTSNCAEGFVLKPISPSFLGDKRVIIKCKNSKFSEKAKSDKSIKQKIVLSDKDSNIIINLTQFYTENRLNNVISHIGEITAKDFSKVAGLLIQDIYKDASNEDIDILDADDVTNTKEAFRKYIFSKVREVWMSVLNK